MTTPANDLIERLRNFAAWARHGNRFPTDAATADEAATALAAKDARIEVLEDALLEIADAKYDNFAANPNKWACMMARKALGLPLQTRDYAPARAALQVRER